MTAYYTPTEEKWRDEKASKAGALNAIELFMCDDGNYRSADAKAAYDKRRDEIRVPYLSRGYV